MKARRAAAAVVALLILVLPALAQENRSGAGFALNHGVVDSDCSATTDVDFTGYSLFWKYGFTDPWGPLISYRDTDDDRRRSPFTPTTISPGSSYPGSISTSPISRSGSASSIRSPSG